MRGEPARLRLGVLLFQNSAEQVTLLARSIDLALESPSAPRTEVAWYDHSPTNALRDILQGLRQPNYQHDPRNRGFAAGHNALMAAGFGGGSDAYVGVNPDAVLHPECLTELVAEWQREPVAGLVEARQFPDEHPKTYDPVTHDTPWCSGCMFLVSRALFEHVGGFDENFFMYCEDVDLSWRARGEGFPTRIAPKALVHHYADGRGPHRDPRHAMLEAGIYLARKYGQPDFERACVRDLGSALSGAPLIPSPNQISPQARAASDFQNGFSFAKARW